MLFVDPLAIGSGVGRVLIDDALRYAARLGWSTLLVQSDPGAEGFYAAHGPGGSGRSRAGRCPAGCCPCWQLPVLRPSSPAGTAAGNYGDW